MKEKGHQVLKGLFSQCRELGLLPVGAQGALEKVFGFVARRGDVTRFTCLSKDSGCFDEIAIGREDGMRSGSLVKT